MLVQVTMVLNTTAPEVGKVANGIYKQVEEFIAKVNTVEKGNAVLSFQAVEVVGQPVRKEFPEALDTLGKG